MGCGASKKAAVAPAPVSNPRVAAVKGQNANDASSVKPEPAMSEGGEFSVKDVEKTRASIATVDMNPHDRMTSPTNQPKTAGDTPVSPDDIKTGSSGSNKLKAKLPFQIEDERTVRVVFCSSFRDLPDERGLVMESVIPKLKEECKNRGLSFVPIDFRWGPDNQVTLNNETLRLSLQAVEYADYFVCALGSIYGWIPDPKNPSSYGPNTELLYPWAADYRNTSVVELECRLSSMIEKPTSHRSFFYFKDPSMDANDKVLRLKRDIGAKQKAYKYLTPEDFSAKFEAEFIEALNEDFPNKPLTPEDYEKKSHKIYARHQLSINHGRQDLTASVEKQISPTSSVTMMTHTPNVVVGLPGSGKSAFMAALWKKMEMTYSDKCFCWTHFVGCSEDSFHLDRLLSRAKADIGGMPILKKQASTQKVEGPDNDKITSSVFDSLFRQISAKQSQGCVVIIDGVNKLKSLDKSLDPEDLSWIPSNLPPRVHVVISTVKTHSTYKTCVQRNWPVHEIPVLQDTDREKIFMDYLGGISKRFNPGQIQTIVQRTEPEMPLYLSAISKEITRVIDSGTIDEKIMPLVNTTNLQQLYVQILSRLEKDYGVNIVERCLSALQLTRIGLSEMELQEYSLEGTPDNGNFLWFGLFFNMKHFMISRKKRITLYHDSIAEAIQSRYLFSHEHTIAGCRGLAKWLHEKYSKVLSENPETAAEIAYLYAEGECWKELNEYLSSESVLQILVSDKYHFEFIEYWNRLKKAGYDDVKPYHEVGKTNPSVGYNLAEYYYDTQNFQRCQELYELIVPTIQEDEKKTIEVFSKLSDVCRLQKSYKKAIEYASQALGKCENVNGPDSKEYGNMLHMIGHLYEESRVFQKAIEYYSQSLAIEEKIYGDDNLILCATLSSIAILCEQIGAYHESLEKYKKALNILEKVKGFDSPDVAVVLVHMSSVSLKLGKLLQAVEFGNRAQDICKTSFGGEHPNTLSCSVNLGHIFQKLGRLEEARGVYEQVTQVIKKSTDCKLDAGALQLNISSIQIALGKYSEAVQTAKNALDERTKKLKPENPMIALSHNHLGLAYMYAGDMEKALESFVTAITLLESATSTCDPLLIPCLFNLASILIVLECFDEAHQSLERIDEIRKVVGDDDRIDTTGIEMGKGLIMRMRGKYDESIAHYDKEFNIRADQYGPRHIEVAKVLNNMAVTHILQKKEDDALQAISQSMEICQNFYGDQNTLTWPFLVNQALIQNQTGKGEATTTLTKAIEAKTKIVGEEHGEVDHLRSILA